MVRIQPLQPTHSNYNTKREQPASDERADDDDCSDRSAGALADHASSADGGKSRTMILFVLAVLIFGSLALMGVVIREIGREISGMEDDGERAAKSKREKDEAKLQKAIEEWRKNR